MKHCRNCKHLCERFGSWNGFGCSINYQEIKHPYLMGGKKCPCYEKYKGEKTKFEYPQIKRSKIMKRKQLGELTKLNEELGIDIFTLFKALKNGFWTKSNGELIFCREDENHTIFIRDLHYEYEICCEQSKNEIGSKCEMYLERSTQDYGKTWALTKEELL